MRRRALLAAETTIGNEIELPIKLYEGNNNPEAEKIIDFIWKNWMQYANEDGQLSFDNYPNIFQSLRNIIHINDTYYCTAIRMNNEQNLMSFGASINTYYLLDDESCTDIISWSLNREGELTIDWD